MTSLQNLTPQSKQSRVANSVKVGQSTGVCVNAPPLTHSLTHSLTQSLGRHQRKKRTGEHLCCERGRVTGSGFYKNRQTDLPEDSVPDEAVTATVSTQERGILNHRFNSKHATENKINCY